jgi:hypothetical protein
MLAKAHLDYESKTNDGMEVIGETKFSTAEQFQSKLNRISEGTFEKVVPDQVVAAGPDAVQSEVGRKIDSAFFTGKADKANCKKMLKDFGDQMQEALNKARDLVQADMLAATPEQLAQERS